MPTVRGLDGLDRRCFRTLCPSPGRGSALPAALWREARALGVLPAGGALASGGSAALLTVGEAGRNGRGLHLTHPPRFS